MSGHYRKSMPSSLRATLRSLRGRAYTDASSLPAEFYTDPDWLGIEREQLFADEWVCVGRVEEVAAPGDYFTFEHVGEPLLIVHGDDGRIRALSNVCRHRGTVLATGRGNSKKFLCPYHHWAYATSGELLNAPQMQEHESFDPQTCRLPELRSECWQGFIFVTLNPRARALAPSLAPLEAIIGDYHLEQMRLRYLADEDWDTNWKCLLENFMEGYHLTPLHRQTLHKVNPSHLCRHFPPGGQFFGYRVGFTTRLPSDRIGHPDLGDEALDTCVMFAIAPGLTVGVGSDYCSFLCLRPLSTAKVRVKMGLFFFGEDWKQRDVDNAVDLFRQTMDEDKQVLLRVQQGLESRLHAPGPLAAADLEGTIWDFYQYLSRKLGDEPATAEDTA